MEIIVGTLKSEIKTDNPKLLKALRDLYTFKIPGAEYSAAYKRRQWDGKKSFISVRGEFRTGLLDSILADLKRIDCEPEITYQEDFEESPALEMVEGFTYYDYQESLISLALEKKRCVIKSPTGSGKTLIMAGLIKSLAGRKMTILFHAKQLLNQTYEFLVEDCGFDNVGLCFGEGYIYGDIMLCTVQSIEKILDTHLHESEVLMVDECHEFCSGKTRLPAIESFPAATYRLGFTATVPSEPINKCSLEGALGSVIQDATTQDLIGNGKLTKPIIQMIDRPYTASGLDEDLGYIGVYDEYITNNESRNNNIKTIVESIRQNNEKSRILILTQSLDHGRILTELIGGEIQYLEGDDSIRERYSAISRFREYEGNSVLIGTKIFQTGVNIKEITHFIIARGLKKDTATIQALGRALRTHESKEVVYVYDFLDKEKYLKDHSNERKKHYKKEGHTVEVIKL